MFRRPLRRAVMLGGVAAVADHAGTVSGERSAEEQAAEAAGPAPAPRRPPPQRPPTPTPKSASSKPFLIRAPYTQAEFDAQKQKILAQ